MCGIAGVIGQQRERLPAMLATMQSRGPDAMRSERFETAGYRAVMGHVRLSILDLDPRSHQPFRSPCSRYWLTFNGEIYNYLELRKQLESGGVEFQTTSDTEVLLHWLLKYGEKGLARLEGMFALGLLDTQDGSLLLARDQIGEKPLYYSSGGPRHDMAFAFASETTALLQLSWVDASLNKTALADYLRFLYTPHPNTLYQGIREMPPGSYLRVEVGRAVGESRQFYNVEDEIDEPHTLSYEETVEGFRETFIESVRLRLQSDVPVGLFLSGGLDSNSILAATQQLGVVDQLKAYTVSYEGRSGADGDESDLARQAADHFGIEHFVSAFAARDDLQDAVDRSLAMFGQPYGNATALPAEAISAEAAKRSRVCLVGDGGDELLNGYPRHRAIAWAHWLRRIVGPFGGAVNAAAQRMPVFKRWEVQANRIKRFTQTLGDSPAESFLRWTTFLNGEQIERQTGQAPDSGFYESLKAMFERHQNTPLLAASLVDLASFVPCKLTHCADRAGMANSLELRSPFLAPPLIRFALAIPQPLKTRGRRVKPILADAFDQQLPAIVKRQPKRPFNPPMRQYLRTKNDSLQKMLLHAGSPIGEILGERFVQDRLNEFQSGTHDHSTMLWGLLVLNRWLNGERSWVRQPIAA